MHMSQVDAETRQLMDEIYLDKALRAGCRSMGEKLLDGPRLFDDCCRLMRSGIRFQFPDYTEDQVNAEFRRRLEIGRRISEKGIYRNAGMIDE